MTHTPGKWEVIAAAPEMYAELKKIEWKYMGTLEDDTDYIICPDCENERAEGHKSGCGLEQALALVEGGQE